MESTYKSLELVNLDYAVRLNVLFVTVSFHFDVAGRDVFKATQKLFISQ